MIGLFIGRFQPPHNGHIAALQEIEKECNEIIIVIGSADKCFTLRDPLTAGERLTMFIDMMPRFKAKIIPVPVPDLDDNRLWVASVIATVPRFDVVYTNNPLVSLLFEHFGYKVKNIHLERREIWTGKVIRDLMLKNDEWKEYVPHEVVNRIYEFKIIERMRRLAGSDEVENLDYRLEK